MAGRPSGGVGLIKFSKENAANLAGFNGAKDVVEGVYLCGDYIAAFPILAIHWGTLI